MLVSPRKTRLFGQTSAPRIRYEQRLPRLCSRSPAGCLRHSGDARLRRQCFALRLAPRGASHLEFSAAHAVQADAAPLPARAVAAAARRRRCRGKTTICCDAPIRLELCSARLASPPRGVREEHVVAAAVAQRGHLLELIRRIFGRHNGRWRRVRRGRRSARRRGRRGWPFRHRVRHAELGNARMRRPAQHRGRVRGSGGRRNPRRRLAWRGRGARRPRRRSARLRHGANARGERRDMRRGNARQKLIPRPSEPAAGRGVSTAAASRRVMHACTSPCHGSAPRPASESAPSTRRASSPPPKECTMSVQNRSGSAEARRKPGAHLHERAHLRGWLVAVDER